MSVLHIPSHTNGQIPPSGTRSNKTTHRLNLNSLQQHVAGPPPIFQITKNTLVTFPSLSQHSHTHRQRLKKNYTIHTVILSLSLSHISERVMTQSP